MITNDLPVVMTCTEELLSELKTEVHSLKMRYFLILDLDYTENRPERYKEDYKAEETRMIGLQNDFYDECRDNYLRINDKQMANRYRKLLRINFAFLADAKTMLQTNQNRFYKEIIGERGDDHEFDSDLYDQWCYENDETYHSTLLSWTEFMWEKFFNTIHESINEVESYLVEAWELDSNSNSAATTSSDQKPVVVKLNVNQGVTWNLSASALYDIFGQLLKMKVGSGYTPIKRESHTVKHLAVMIYQNIHFANGCSPSLATIERELQQMADKDGRQVKRNKITIDCRSERDSL